MKQQFFNYQLATDLAALDLSEGSQHPQVVACLNPHSFVTALDDGEYRRALESCDLLLPDGEGICLALRRYRGVEIGKIAGDDLHQHLLSRLEAQGGKVFYMGSSQKVLARIEARLRREYPHVQVLTHSPSYCAQLPEAESAAIVAEIEAFAPDVLFVSMTAPKQEKWVAAHASRLTTPKVIASIGAVFDFYSGTVKRAPDWAVRLRLEWLVRLLKEPRRMWRRNFVSTPRFLRWVKQHREEM